MWHFYVRRQIRKVINQINHGNYEYLLSHCHERLPHGYCFAGTHPLGGTRHTVSAMRRFYQRLFLLFPDLHIEIKEIFVKGWPWYTLAAVWWVDRANPRTDTVYVNEGAQILHLRWGRVAGAQFYLDTQKVDSVCRSLAQQGVCEAAAPPVLD